jgi:hypothetical protein
MDGYQQFANQLFDVDYEEKERQEVFHRFATEAIKISGQLNLDLLELRQSLPTTRFLKALSKLTTRQIEAIGDFPDFVQTARDATPDGLVGLIQTLTNSQRPLTEIHAQIRRAVASINRTLPFSVPARGAHASRVVIIHVQDGITLLSADTALFRMTTVNSDSRDFLIQRSSRPGGFHRSVLTLLHVLTLVRAMLLQSYTARSRNLAVFEGDVIEAGAGVLIVPVPAPAVTLEALFRAAAADSPREWLARHADPALPADALQRAMVARVSPQFFLRLRPRLAQSFGLAALLRELFGARYPALHRVVLGLASDRVPLLPLDFDADGGAGSAFRLSPNIAVAVGGGRTGEIALAIAAAAKALTENVEAMRALIEVLIGDDDIVTGKIRTIRELADERTRFERKFLAFCPPRIADVAPHAGEEWLATVERVVAAAADADAQPPEAIPWF